MKDTNSNASLHSRKLSGIHFTGHKQGTGKKILLCTKIQFLKIDELSNFGRNFFFWGGGGETFLRNCLRKNISNVMETF